MACLRSVMDGYMLPRVIVKDRELALMNAHDTAFPNAKGLLCRWHINRSGTNRFLHFGNQTTNRVESQHAKLKLYLDSTQCDWLTAVSYIHEVVNSQEETIHSSLEHSKIVIRHRYNVPIFTNLNKRISLHALDILFEEYERCVDGDDDLGCQVKVEVENFNKEFKKKSRAGKKSLLRKMKEITMPSETSLSEPATQKAIGGRSSFKRAPADQPSQMQEPARYNFSSMPSFVGKDDFMNQKPRSVAYIDQFSSMFHP
ncbi:FAR-RED impaired response 1-like protein [Tanacetum coccineum]|uniref:FAR-RED impaired response 1-like protein n=1 Tax=Tanacetum coccineum TaxID=301880 RepID=A0ABQ5IG21_9ASTR